MCWNAPVSIITWVTSIIGAGLLIKRGTRTDIWNALFVLTFSSIQLLEFFMWIDQSCSGINQIATKIALVVLWLQPLSQCIGWLYASNDKKYVNYILIPIVTYSLCALYTMIRVIKAGDTCSKPAKCFSLHWNFNKASSLSPTTGNWKACILYGIGMLGPLFFQKPITRRVTLIIVNVVSLLLLCLYYWPKGESVSSMWCFTSNVYVWLAYFIK